MSVHANNLHTAPGFSFCVVQSLEIHQRTTWVDLLFISHSVTEKSIVPSPLLQSHHCVFPITLCKGFQLVLLRIKITLKLPNL